MHRILRKIHGWLIFRRVQFILVTLYGVRPIWRWYIIIDNKEYIDKEISSLSVKYGKRVMILGTNSIIGKFMIKTLEPKLVYAI